MTPYRLVVAGLVAVLALVVGLNGLGHFYTDIKPEVYLAPGRMVGRYLSAWTSSPYLGSPNFNVGLVPVLLVTAALRGIGLSPEWTYKLFHFVLWLVAAWGAARLMRRLLPSGGRIAGLAAGALFIANPYAVQGGSTLAIALPMAVLPWLLLVFVNAVRDHRGWVWPAAFGLLFFATSGMNVAVVPVLQLLGLLPIMLVARLDWRIGWGAIASALGKCALFTLGVSIYWLWPSIAALSTGAQIVSLSETLDGIAKVSSYAEVLRGMGMWSLYGSSSAGPWVPQFAAYLTNPVIMALSVLWPVLALLSLRWVRGSLRLIAAGAVALATVIMVGLFPGAANPASPFGHLLKAVLSIPALSAFRTTNKIGSVLALGFALALGAGVWRLVQEARRRDGLALIAAPLVVVLVAGWILPALTNRLYTSQMDVPAYWHAAAAKIDSGRPDGRVLFLPGQTRPTYRWTAQRPDDVANSLLTRDAVIPETTPNASAPGGNFLAALDDTLQEGHTPAGAISTFARYLGADQVLLRNDTVWEQDGGIRPSDASATVSADQGLFGIGNFGSPGEYVYGAGTHAGAHHENLLSPLQLFAVKDARDAVRTEPMGNSVLVAGDGWSVPAMTRAGLLGAAPTFQYASDVPAGAMGAYFGPGHTMVITDTNARRAAIPNRLSNGEGPLLAADESVPDMRTLGASADDQTVLLRSGPRVTASQEGGAFFALPYGVAANAVDGNPNSSWLFGDFRRAPGTTLTIDEPAPVKLGTVRIAQSQIGPVHIDKLTVTANGHSVTKRMPDSGYASFDFGSMTTSRVSVRVDSIRGEGDSLVGIADIQLAGPTVSRAARTPLTLTKRYADLGAADRARFAATPLDVLLTRVSGTDSTTDDPQTGLRRLVSLPDKRTFTVKARVRIDGSVETAYDRLAGVPADLQATSSDFWFQNSDVRASMATDGDPRTAWVPGGDVADSWWQLQTPRRSISHVTIDQENAFGGDATTTRYADHAVVTVDGRVVAQATIAHRGTTTLRFPTVQGSTVRVTFDKALGPPAGTAARFPTIDTGAIVRPDNTAPAQEVDGQRCLPVATIDGQPVLMHPSDARLAGPNDNGSEWVGCGDVTMAAGDRRIEQAPGFTLDNLSFTDTVHRSTATPSAPATKVLEDSDTAKKLRVSAAAPYAVVIGQSFDPRWHATIDGRSLGAPQTIDGYSVGWIVDRAGTHTISVSFAPQTGSNIALGISIAVLLLAAALLVIGLRRGRLVTTPVPAALSTVGRSSVGGSRRRVVEQIGLALLAGFAVGWAGLVAAVALVVLLRVRPVRSWWLLVAGAGLVGSSLVVYLFVLGSTLGQVSADAVARSMWPHRLAGAGLVVALAGAVRMWKEARQRT